MSRLTANAPSAGHKAGLLLDDADTVDGCGDSGLRGLREIAIVVDGELRDARHASASVHNRQTFLARGDVGRRPWHGRGDGDIDGHVRPARDQTRYAVARRDRRVEIR